MQIIFKYYYWSNMRIIVDQYVRNCHICRRSKISNNCYNGLFIFLAVFEQRWQNITMNFIIGFFEFYGNNAICTIIDKFSKERYYALCYVKDKSIFVEAIAKILV